MFAGLQIDNPI